MKNATPPVPTLMKNAINVIMILAYTLIGIYFGAGSITRVNIEEKAAKIDAKKDSLSKIVINMRYNGSAYTNEYDYEYDLALSDMNNFQLLKKLKLNTMESTIVAAASFGQLGAVISLLLIVVSSRTGDNDLRIWSCPFLGMLTGLVVVALINLLPSLLVKNGGEVRPYTLMFISLFCGIYNQEFYNFLKNTFVHKILNPKNDEKN